MNKELLMRTINAEGKKEIVRNVEVTNYWGRHTQKKSGEVFSVSGDGISTSAISGPGAKRAEDLGKKDMAPKSNANVAKGYRSDQIRTEETLDNIFTGYQKVKPNTKIEKAVRIKEELSLSYPKEFDKLYDQKWTVNKKIIMTEKNIPYENFSKLSPDEQEKIAEKAEEPVIQEWLSSPDSELAKLHPPKDAAADFAVLFNQRHERLVRKLKDDTKLDLFHNTHKTVTEPFWVSGVLIDNKTGEKITKLEQLGESMAVLEYWTSKVKTDNEGKMEIIVEIRDREFRVDDEVLQALVEHGLDRKKNTE
ncbi:MAG: hypothetical protein ABIJ91_03405 [Candidatus Kuenenbacteria bacterium]